MTTLSVIGCSICRRFPRQRCKINSFSRSLSSVFHTHDKPWTHAANSKLHKHYARDFRAFHTSVTARNTVISEQNGETIIGSPYPDIAPSDATFPELMFGCLDEYKNLELMVDYPTGRTFTGSQIKDSALRVASGLYKLGYRKGDVIVLLSTNCPESTIMFLACSYIGVVVSTANPVYTPGELARQLVHSESMAVVTQTELLPVVTEALTSNQEASQAIKEVIILNGTADKCRPFSTLLEDDGKSLPDSVDIDPGQDILTLPYSSGTTGLPKGVMLTHTNMVMNLLQAKHGQMKFRTGEEVMMGLLPFYHIYGLMVLQFGTLSQGAKVIVHPKFEPQLFLQSVEDYKVSYAHLVPPVVLFLAKHPMVDDFNTSSLDTLISAAAPMGIGVTHEIENRLNVNLLQAYGLTESSPLTHYDEVPHKRGTIGTLVPSTTSKVIDSETGQVLNVGETGEILIKGPQVMKGYLKNPEATADTVRDGWLYTGDIGHVDAEGSFTISDRRKELIKYKGFQVAPAELEALLCTHQCIQDAAVIGLTVEGTGEIPKAFVVTKPGTNVSADDIMQFVEKNVAPYKKLRGGVEFIEEIPKTASGKILRRNLK